MGVRYWEKANLALERKSLEYSESPTLTPTPYHPHEVFMGNYSSKTITNAGLALLTQVSNASGTLEFSTVKCGSGRLADPAAATDIVSVEQTFSAIDIKKDSAGNPYIYFQLDNANLTEGYLRTEIGIFGKESGSGTETLILYLVAPTDADADSIPIPSSGIADLKTFRVQISQASGVSTSVSVDGSTVYLNLSRWTSHLSGAGGADQHPVATASTPGLLSVPDKTKIDSHINTTNPTKGTTIHAVADADSAGFESSAHFVKTEGIQAGAEVNQNAFSIIKVGSTNVTADSKTDILELAAGANIVLTPDATTDKVTIAAPKTAGYTVKWRSPDGYDIAGFN